MKRILFLGSSITYGSGEPPRSFVEPLCEGLRVSYLKEAVSGTTLADNEGSYLRRLKEIDKNQRFDLFVCQLSTNDVWRNERFGNVDDMDPSTVFGAINGIIAYVKETWGCPILFYTSARFENARYGEMVGMLHQVKGIDGIIDLWGDPSFEALRKPGYMKDEIHPTTLGYEEWWVPYMKKAIKAYL